MSRGWRIADGALAHIPQRPTAAGEVFLVDHDVQYSPRLLVEVTVIRDARGRATDLEIRPKEARLEWALMAQGAYLPTSHQLPVERSRCLRAMVYPAPPTRGRLLHRKSDLWLRTVVHQKTERVEAYLLVCFLTLALWRTLEMWMRQRLGHLRPPTSQRSRTVRSMDVILPLKDRGEVRLSVVAKPGRPVAELLHRLGVILPRASKM